MACDDHLDLSVFRASHIHNDLIRANGDDTTHCMGAVLSIGGDRLGIGLHRGPTGGAFTPAEVDALQSVLGHLDRMSSIRARLTAAGRAAGRSEAVLDRLPVSILHLDARGRVLFANTAARALLQDRDGATEAAGRLRLSDTAADDRLSALLARISRDNSHGESFPVPRPEGRAPHRLMAAPLYDGAAVTVMVVLVPPDPPPFSASAALQGAFGLTPAEADIACGLIEGLSPEEIAERRGARLSTARSQIKALRRKTDSRTLVQAVAEMSRLVALAPTSAGD